MSMVPECWHGDECPWHKRGRCLFKHCAPPPVELTGGEVPVEQQLRDLRRALQRLAAAVMWRDGVPVPQVVKGTLETMTERTEVVDVQCHRLWKSSRSASRSVCTNRPSINQATKHAEFPQIYCIDKLVDTPVVMQ